MVGIKGRMNGCFVGLLWLVCERLLCWCGWLCKLFGRLMVFMSRCAWLVKKCLFVVK